MVRRRSKAGGSRLDVRASCLLVCLCAAPALAIVAPTSASAQQAAAADDPGEARVAGSGLTDYRVVNDEWNGLSSLALIAETAGATLNQVEEVTVSPDSIERPLLIIYPATELPVAALGAFVEAGGRMLLADDFGTSDGLAQRFGLERNMPTLGGDSFDENDALPYLHPVGVHRLSEGARTIVANHPAAWRGEGLPVYGFEEDAGLVYDMSLGEGRAVFVADPSLFINLMLPIEDNAQLASNILRHLCEDLDPCVVDVASRDARIIAGEAPPDDGNRSRISLAVRNIDSAFDDMQNLEPDPRALKLAAILLMLGAIAVAITVFPVRRPEWLRYNFRPTRPASMSDFELSIDRYRGKLAAEAFDVPASILRDIFEPSFYGSVERDIPPPGRRGAPARAEAAAIWIQAYEPDKPFLNRRIRRLRTTLDVFGSLPRTDLSGLTSTALVDRRTMMRVHRDATRILTRMNLEDEITRRTGRPAASA